MKTSVFCLFLIISIISIYADEEEKDKRTIEKTGKKHTEEETKPETSGTESREKRIAKGKKEKPKTADIEKSAEIEKPVEETRVRRIATKEKKIKPANEETESSETREKRLATTSKKGKTTADSEAEVDIEKRTIPKKTKTADSEAEVDIEKRMKVPSETNVEKSLKVPAEEEREARIAPKKEKTKTADSATETREERMTKKTDIKKPHTRAVRATKKIEPKGKIIH